MTRYTRETIETFIDDFLMETVAMGCEIIKAPTWSDGDTTMTIVLLPKHNFHPLPIMTPLDMAKVFKDEMDKVGLKARKLRSDRRGASITSHGVRTNFTYDLVSVPEKMCIAIIAYFD